MGRKARELIEELTLPQNVEEPFGYELLIGRDVASEFAEMMILGSPVIQDAQASQWHSQGSTLYLVDQSVDPGLSTVSLTATGSVANLLTKSFRLLYTQNEDLRIKIRELGERLGHLEAEAPTVKTVLLREIGREEAKEEIRQVYTLGKPVYYSEIVERLGIDLELVVDISRELMDEGVIRRVPEDG